MYAIFVTVIDVLISLVSVKRQENITVGSVDVYTVQAKQRSWHKYNDKSVGSTIFEIENHKIGQKQNEHGVFIGRNSGRNCTVSEFI